MPKRIAPHRSNDYGRRPLRFCLTSSFSVLHLKTMVVARVVWFVAVVEFVGFLGFVRFLGFVEEQATQSCLYRDSYVSGFLAPKIISFVMFV